MTHQLFRFRESAAIPALRPVPCPLLNAAVPPALRLATFRRDLPPGEASSLPYACPSCKAPAWQLCYSGTGLPASVPCPARPREAARGGEPVSRRQDRFSQDRSAKYVTSGQPKPAALEAAGGYVHADDSARDAEVEARVAAARSEAMRRLEEVRAMPAAQLGPRCNRCQYRQGTRGHLRICGGGEAS